ncbi:MAG: type secretion system protein [Herminiimonas sp.]|jgi:general secretion pathway protein M|nr:type secretion system protein [Herminiimonas sp.]
MNPTETMNRLAQSLSEFWAARNARERNLLAAAAAVVALGLVYALLIGPASSGRDQLNRSLPVLRQQVAQLQNLSKEAAGLSTKTAPSVAPISRENIEAALTRKGLKPQNVALTGDIAKVQLSSASFAGILDWLDDMQKTSLVSVVDANIVALAQPDMVNATLTLRQQKSE